MKKTTSITINNTLFYLEDDAYAALEGYLASVREFFSASDDTDEILKDIEARIAEKFEESDSKTSPKTIALSKVEEVIKDIGTVEQLKEADSDKSGSSDAREGAQGSDEYVRSGKTLYRDPDNAIIAGVSSGLGFYFNIDPVLFRVLFIVLTFTSGIGILLYVILWITMPEAKTASQKLAMRGNPVNLKTMRSMASNTIKDGVSKARNPIRKTVKFLERHALGFLRIATGIMMGAISFGGIVALTIAAGMALSGYPVSLFDPTVAGVLTGPLFYGAVAAVYLAAAAPLIFIGFCSADLLFRTSKVNKANTLLLLSIWFVALTASGLLVTSTVFKSMEAVANDPGSAAETRIMQAPGEFSRIEAKSVRVKIVQGSETSIIAEGRKGAIDRVSLVAEEGVLKISRNMANKECLFCDIGTVDMTITVPDLSGILLENAASLTGKLTTDSLTIELRNSSRADMEVTTRTLATRLENSSRISLTGTAGSATTTLKNASNYQASSLKTENMTVSASNASRAEIWVTGNLIVSAENASRIEHRGGATILEERLLNGSRLINLDQERKDAETAE